ncbi:ABC transporter substrate-binding protein [Streptomyces sp. MP131-18]|uniref:ABC transporter substrate-binding protein n=1 Tax=Streptomyces sp. MP131-18 TaxID=1857892 RepID=UPI00097BDE26|nr:ABC transporter substrate-binding protein [Streptomyces sp. MP131-18]ONK14330.1 ABC transporter, substrate-binding protein, aliphatic sulfonates family [Streptomyces sp. MP131-18]
MPRRNNAAVAAAAAAAGLLAVQLGACAPGGSEGTGGGGGGDTIRIAHNSNAGVLSARVADEQGFFEEQGVEVEFTQVENVETLPPALGSSFDVVLSTPTLLLSGSAQGLDIVEAAGTSVEVPDNPTAAVIGSEGTGVQSAEDLAGKTIGVLNETGTLRLATQYWLDQAGVPLDSIGTVQVDPPAGKDQLMAGRVDAVETVTPFIDDILAEEEAGVVAYPHLEMAQEIGLILWATSGQWAQDNPEALEGFRSGLEQAVEWIGNPANEQDARDSLRDFTGLPDEVVDSLTLPVYSADPRPQDHEIWLAAMQDYAGFRGDVDLDELVAGE